MQKFLAVRWLALFQRHAVAGPLKRAPQQQNTQRDATGTILIIAVSPYFIYVTSCRQQQLLLGTKSVHKTPPNAIPHHLIVFLSESVSTTATEPLHFLCVSRRIILRRAIGGLLVLQTKGEPADCHSRRATFC